MSIDLSKVTGLSDQFGEITQITDASGRVIWKIITATDEPPAIFEVAKQTSTTYVGETAYADEEFILFDIYPKKGGTVKVTYGGLTKTIKDTSGAEEPNAQQVFFGTFNGVSDSVATPTSGRLTIEGAYRGYGAGAYTQSPNKPSSSYAPCVTSVIDFGNPVYIGRQTFSGCTNITPTSLPSGLTGEIGEYTFRGCTNLALTSLPNGITSIGQYAFSDCTNLALTSLPSGITSIGFRAFEQCAKIAITSLPNGLKTVDGYAFYECKGIKSLIIPASVESLGQYSLCCNTRTDDWSILHISTAFRFLGTTPPRIKSETTNYTAFGGGKTNFDNNIIVPKGYGEAYKTAWENYYTEYIVEAS